MVTLGGDCHKESHTLVAVNLVGRKIAELTVSNRPASYEQVLTWAQQLDAERVWGIETSGSFGRGLAQYLGGQDERGYEVSPHLTGRKRRTSLDRDKSDPTDALAIGRVVLQEGQHLPQVQPEDASSVLGVVVEYREYPGRRTDPSAQSVAYVPGPRGAELQRASGGSQLQACQNLSAAIEWPGSLNAGTGHSTIGHADPELE